MISIDTTKPLSNPYNLATDIVEQLPDLYERLAEADKDGGGFYDYIEGLIDAKLSVLYALGVDPKDIPNNPNN
jgi:hypothetical protein